MTYLYCSGDDDDDGGDTISRNFIPFSNSRRSLVSTHHARCTIIHIDVSSQYSQRTYAYCCWRDGRLQPDDGRVPCEAGAGIDEAQCDVQ